MRSAIDHCELRFRHSARDMACSRQGHQLIVRAMHEQRRVRDLREHRPEIMLGQNIEAAA